MDEIQYIYCVREKLCGQKMWHFCWGKKSDVHLPIKDNYLRYIQTVKTGARLHTHSVTGEVGLWTELTFQATWEKAACVCAQYKTMPATWSQ